MIRVEQPDDQAFVHGVVAQDKSKAIFAYVALNGTSGSLPNSLRILGLDPNANYRVKLVEPAGEAFKIARQSPIWFDGVTLTGAALEAIGLKTPVLAPEQAILVEATRL